jgi:hypothetical protein
VSAKLPAGSCASGIQGKDIGFGCRDVSTLGGYSSLKICREVI